MSIGEYIYVLKEPTNKLGDQYTGPYEVLELLGNHNLKIRLSKRSKTIHIDKIKKLHNAPIPPPRERQGMTTSHQRNLLAVQRRPINSEDVPAAEDVPTERPRRPASSNRDGWLWLWRKGTKHNHSLTSWYQHMWHERPWAE